MTSSKYYIDELTYLRELGREFALAHPQAAPMLAEAGADPDVERLLEGFAFLTAQIREKLDDEQGHFNQQLIQFMWPHYLRPVPSATIVQFAAKPQALRETRTIPAGAILASKPVDGTICHFTTTNDVVLAPVMVAGLEVHSQPSPALHLKLSTVGGTSFATLNQSRLRLFLSGERAVSRALYGCLLGNLKCVKARGSDGKEIETALTVEAVGFTDSQALVPGMERTFPALRMIQEYLSFPQKFMFVDVVGIDQLRILGDKTSVELIFQLNRLPVDMPPVTAANIQLQCAPAVNVFAHEADPITYDRRRNAFKLRPMGADQQHYDIYRIESVRGLNRSNGSAVEYRQMFRPGRKGDDRRFYFTSFSPSAVMAGNDHIIGLVDDPDAEIGTTPDVISVSLTCTNRQLPTRLGPGDVSQATPHSPTFATFKNITRPTPSYPPPPPGEQYWRLIAHFSLGHSALSTAQSLREIIGLYDFAGLVDRQLERSRARLLEGIEGVEAIPATRLYRGAPVRGLSVRVRMGEEHVGGEGEMYLLGSVLNELFANCVSLNSYSRMEVVGTRFSEVFAWPARIGRRAIL